MSKPKLDIVNRDTVSNEDAIRYLEEVLENVRADGDVEGVVIIVERSDRITSGGSYSKNWFARLGHIEVAKQQVLCELMGED